MSKAAIQSTIDAMSFEQALAELESIVRELESGQGDLDKAIVDYERGTQLKDHCMKKLGAARLKVEKIMQNQQGAVNTMPFDGEGN
jgi:exodeoxyribonuclease VII small subunit